MEFNHNGSATNYGGITWNSSSTLAFVGVVCGNGAHVFMNGPVCQCGLRDMRKHYCGICGKEIGCKGCGQK